MRYFLSLPPPPLRATNVRIQMSEPATISDVGTRETTRSVAHAATDGLRVRSPAWIYDNGCDVAATCNTAYTEARWRWRPCLDRAVAADPAPAAAAPAADPSRPWIFIGGTVMARYRRPGCPVNVMLQDSDSRARFPGTVWSIDQAKSTGDISFDENDRDQAVPFACIDPPLPPAAAAAPDAAPDAAPGREKSVITALIARPSNGNSWHVFILGWDAHAGWAGWEGTGGAYVRG